MKYVKMLGLAAVAAAALTAFVGASSASATVLCTTPGTGTPTGTTCPEGWAAGPTHEIHAVNTTNATLTSNESFKPNIVCEVSTVKGHPENEGSATETVRGAIEVLTFEKCGESEVKVLNKGSLEIHWIEGTHNGTLTGTGQEITTVTPSIFGNIHCIYKTNSTHLGVLNGGETASLTAASKPIPHLETSSLCPSGPTWDATYSITTPDHLYVTGHT